MKKQLSRKNRTKARYASPAGLSQLVDLVEKGEVRKEALNPTKIGQTVKVHVRIKEGEKERIQVFEGVVIKKGNRGSQKSFTVRKVSHGVGVERVFLDNSPKVAKVEVVKTGKVRRAKLYFLRKLEGKAARLTTVVKRKAAPAEKAAQ